MNETWHRACALGEVTPGAVTACRLAGREVAVCPTPEGLYAIEDRCTHAETRMSEGRLRACRVTCPLHGASFDVRDGRVLGGPASGPLDTYPVRISGGYVEVLLPDPGAMPAGGEVVR